MDLKTFRHKVTHQWRTGPGHSTGMGGVSPNLNNIKHDCSLSLLTPDTLLDISVLHTLTQLNITRCQRHARTVGGERECEGWG